MRLIILYIGKNYFSLKSIQSYLNFLNFHIFVLPGIYKNLGFNIQLSCSVTKVTLQTGKSLINFYLIYLIAQLISLSFQRYLAT